MQNCLNINKPIWLANHFSNIFLFMLLKRIHAYILSYQAYNKVQMFLLIWEKYILKICPYRKSNIKLLSIWSLGRLVHWHTYLPAPIVLYKKFQQEINEEMPQEVLYCGRLMQYLENKTVFFTQMKIEKPWSKCQYSENFDCFKQCKIFFILNTLKFIKHLKS